MRREQTETENTTTPNTCLYKMVGADKEVCPELIRTHGICGKDGDDPKGTLMEDGPFKSVEECAAAVAGDYKPRDPYKEYRRELPFAGGLIGGASAFSSG